VARPASDYPTEFSVAIAKNAGKESPLGPYFLHRREDGVVIGEIGDGFIDTETVEIGYAIVQSCWNRGYATDAVRAIAQTAREIPEIKRIIAHNPVNRPASGRVLQAAAASIGRPRLGRRRL
jgi:RimJ/RimL family protein N-acetyltransferase